MNNETQVLDSQTFGDLIHCMDSSNPLAVGFGSCCCCCSSSASVFISDNLSE